MADDTAPLSTQSDTPTISAPVSAYEALAQTDSSPVSETPSDPPADTPVAATTPPAAESSPTSPATPDVPTPGPVPYDRFVDVTRQRKALADQLKRYEAFAQLSESELTALSQWNRQLQENPLEAYRALQQTVQADPALAAHLAPAAAPRPAAAADAMPEADLRAEDGTLVYSATQMRAMQDWTSRQLRTQLLDEMKQQLQPLESVAQSVQHERAQVQAWSEVSTMLAEFRADPQFAQHEAGIRQMLLDDARLAELADANPRLAVELAYGRIYRETIAPAERAQTTQAVVDNLRQRAVSGTTNPAQPRSMTPPRTLGDARAALASVFTDS